jgi:hypothetical protein
VEERAIDDRATSMGQRWRTDQEVRMLSRKKEERDLSRQRDYLKASML